MPSGVWIDEQGMIVRPPEPAFPGRAVIAELPDPARGSAARSPRCSQEAAKIRIEPERYLAALRDWVDERRREPLRARARRGRRALGAAARRDARGRRPASSSASTCTARATRTTPCAGSARRTGCSPDNWTYKRQAWAFVDPILQGPSEQYEGDWLSDVREIGAENYYPPVEL